MTDVSNGQRFNPGPTGHLDQQKRLGDRHLCFVTAKHLGAQYLPDGAHTGDGMFHRSRSNRLHRWS